MFFFEIVSIFYKTIHVFFEIFRRFNNIIFPKMHIVRFNDDIKKKTFEEELEFHSKIAQRWWNPKKCLLHSLNTVRVPLISTGCQKVGLTIKPSDCVLKDLKILDVGCGVGILSEALVHLGGEVTGIDPAEFMIKLANEHAQKADNFISSLRYENIPIEKFCKKHEDYFDVVVVSEVIEHVEEQKQFLRECIKCLKPGGSFFITAPNKTLLSRIILIHIYENCGVIPKGMHQFNKFISLKDISEFITQEGLNMIHDEGYFCNPFTKKIVRTPFLRMWYGLHAQKNRRPA